MTLEALFLVILTACLLPWMAWISTVLIKIEIRLAKGDEALETAELIFEALETALLIF